MRTRLLLMVSLILFCSLSYAQRAKIVTEAVSPHQLETLGLDDYSVATGLDVVGNETYVFLSPQNIGNSDTITDAVFTFVSRPAGSEAAFETVNTNWAAFRPDVKGAYVVRLTITTASGTHDTTKTIYSSDFVGVGNFEGIRREYPNCMTCHENHPRFVEIFNRWQESGHATVFQIQVETNDHYGESCIQCHTTGYNPEANNNGFDDVAERLGWSFVPPTNPGKWDTLVTEFPGLVQFATIGCESCHGPGSEHTEGANPAKIAISLEAGVCAQCHDEPWRHNKVSEWENSLHSEAIWSNSFAQAANRQNNSLANCIRCHDAKGYVNFTKGQTTNTTGMVVADHTAITCQTCHDPHGNTNHASLRNSPDVSDTLANGYQYTLGGTGQLCMDCHKARGNGDALTAVTSSHWGPHHSVQSDNLFGENAAKFDDTPYLSSPHKFAVENACVDCHMVATVEPENINRDKVGGHSFSLHNAETDFDYTAACARCHGPKESFESFTARLDFDEDGQVESVRQEIAGLVSMLANELPPKDTEGEISWEAIRDANDQNVTKAYWNYQIIAYDGSGGMHNTMYAVDVLRKSIMAIGGPLTSIQLEDVETPGTYALAQNYPNPFNPSTTIRYSVPFASLVKINVYTLTGELVRELVNGEFNTGTYETMFNAYSGGKEISSGVYFYTVEAKSLDGTNTFRETRKMILMK